jgi:hypothetical protein
VNGAVLDDLVRDAGTVVTHDDAVVLDVNIDLR